jgi:hypothetical protein
MALKTHGITESTPKNLLLGAGAFYKDLVYAEDTGWSGTVLGATSGGGQVNLTPEYLDLGIDFIDGATVSVDGLIFKVADVAEMVVNMTEITEANLTGVLHLQEDTTETVEGYKKFISVKNLGTDAFIDNVAYVGTLTSGEQIIVRFPKAVCKGALALSTTNKEVSTYEVTFSAVAPFEQTDLEHLAYEIYYPQATTPQV